jgi:cell division protein FtsI/penicillin-binding protein 2
VAGKTGTARKVPYDRKQYYASFVGVFPASAPQICIVVTVNEPDKAKVGYYGGTVAGPLFAELGAFIGKHLNIKPDKSPTQSKLVNR